MPLWNIRNNLCEATTQISWARNVENVTGSDAVTESRSSKIDNYSKNSHLYGLFKMLSLEKTS